MSIEIGLPLLFAAGLAWLAARLWRLGRRVPHWADPPGAPAGDWVQRVPRVLAQPHAVPRTATSAVGAAERGAASEPDPIANASPAPAASAEARTAAPPRPQEVTGSGGNDDLQRIKGIGPVIERELRARGVARFAQIAAWGPEDVERLGAELGFGNRIERDGWVEQARRLAAGDSPNG